MKPSEDLFEIIKSMTKSEKRYFKIYSNLQSGNRKENMNYLKLFNEIERQAENGNEYDESKIKEKFKKDNFIKQLTFTKNYLYNQIFKSMFNFYSDVSSDYELGLNFFKTKYLYRKGLFEQYFKSYKVLKDTALKYEKYGSYIDILKLERIIVKMKDYLKHKQIDYYEEEKQAIKKIENLTAYSKLTREISNLYRTERYSMNAATHKKINELKNHYLLSNESAALTIQAKEYYWFLNAFLARIENNIELNSEFNKKRLQIVENHPDSFRDSIINIKQACLENLIINAIYQKDFKTYKEVFDKLNSLKLNEREAEKNFKVTLKYIEFLNNRNVLDNNQLLNTIDDMFNLIASNSKIFDRDFELEFYYKSLVTLIELNEFERALKFCNVILNHDINELRKDILIKTRILNLLVHFELHNYELLKYLIKNTKYHLSKSREIDISEKVFIQFLTRFISKKDNKSKKKVLSKFKNDFELLKNPAKDANISESFDYSAWISKKAEEYR
ncbi:MAG TPA: hypothetical protein VHP32_01980 [Ignavibacteria bacterium]|nr:hypothetical protein [Ignavibacteria bacterium]